LDHLTRHSKTMIHLSFRGIESFWVLWFLSDHVGLSVHLSRDA
jgi:hypothetical protein